MAERVATWKDHNMDVLEKALRMLEKRPLCDHCLGRQFALLGHGTGNDERGKSIKTVLIFNAQTLTSVRGDESTKTLKTLATNGFSQSARDILHKAKKRLPSEHTTKCYLCENRIAETSSLVGKALELLKDYEYTSFLVGIELPIAVAEREDDFKAEFEVTHGENMRNEFGRIVGKTMAEQTGKEVDFKRPEIVALANPFTGKVRLQVNPLFVAGRYTKLVRDMPQSKWFCSKCRGKGCKDCGYTGKMYPESVEEIVEKPLLDAAEGLKGSFHASGREDIDARMLGNGRPFVAEITHPKKRFLDLRKIEKAINTLGKNKVQVSDLQHADRDYVRKLKEDESKQKEYLVTVEFQKKISAKDLHMLMKKLSNTLISQRTPVRVMHRRADLTREKYIYDVKAKKLSLHRAELRIRCAGGLYVKELVSGDEGRTTPSVTELLNNRAKPVKLDVLNIIMGNQEEVER